MQTSRAELYGMDACCVRFADVYGRLDRNTGARNRHNAPYWVCKAAAAGQVRSKWKNPDFLLLLIRNLDFLLKNVEFITKNVDFTMKTARLRPRCVFIYKRRFYNRK